MSGRHGGAQLAQSWSAEGYAANAWFVPEMGGEILEWLAPRAGERILDLGCGDGVLTQRIVEAGALVSGVDASADMVAAAVRRGIDATVVSGDELGFDSAFDAVFSNAALHWMTNADAVAGGVARALRPGGRFVAEFGGQGNIASIVTAIQAALQRFGGAPELAHPWFFPTLDEYRAVLNAAGFTTVRAALVPRPTPLPTGMAGWLETFAGPYFDQFEAAKRTEVMDYVVSLLAPALCDSAGNWTADYVRLRFEARL